MKTFAEKQFVLATDLDGTFLGGSDAERSHLYDWIEQRRESVGLLFVTGRDPDFIRDLTSDGSVPSPDLVIGDVGTTIATFSRETGVEPIPELEAQIVEAWGDSGDRVRTSLEGISGLALQPTEFRFRVSYDMDPKELDPRAFDIIQGMGFDVITSADRYFDVLPKGVSKGPSLLRLIDHLGLRKDKVLAAGDTLNDLSMLAVGVPAVAVGGSEPDLLSAVADMDHVFKAKRIGAAGIFEAIGAFGLHTDA